MPGRNSFNPFKRHYTYKKGPKKTQEENHAIFEKDKENARKLRLATQKPVSEKPQGNVYYGEGLLGTANKPTEEEVARWKQRHEEIIEEKRKAAEEFKKSQEEHKARYIAQEEEKKRKAEEEARRIEQERINAERQRRLAEAKRRQAQGQRNRFVTNGITEAGEGHAQSTAQRREMTPEEKTYIDNILATYDPKSKNNPYSILIYNIDKNKMKGNTVDDNFAELQKELYDENFNKNKIFSKKDLVYRDLLRNIVSPEYRRDYGGADIRNMVCGWDNSHQEKMSDGAIDYIWSNLNSNLKNGVYDAFIHSSDSESNTRTLNHYKYKLSTDDLKIKLPDYDLGKVADFKVKIPEINLGATTTSEPEYKLVQKTNVDPQGNTYISNEKIQTGTKTTTKSNKIGGGEINFGGNLGKIGGDFNIPIPKIDILNDEDFFRDYYLTNTKSYEGSDYKSNRVNTYLRYKIYDSFPFYQHVTKDMMNKKIDSMSDKEIKDLLPKRTFVDPSNWDMNKVRETMKNFASNDTQQFPINQNNNQYSQNVAAFGGKLFDYGGPTDNGIYADVSGKSITDNNNDIDSYTVKYPNTTQKYYSYMSPSYGTMEMWSDENSVDGSIDGKNFSYAKSDNPNMYNYYRNFNPTVKNTTYLPTVTVTPKYAEGGPIITPLQENTGITSYQSKLINRENGEDLNNLGRAHVFGPGGNTNVPYNTPYNMYKEGEAPEGWYPATEGSDGIGAVYTLPTVTKEATPSIGSVAWNDQHPIANTALDFMPIIGDIKGLTYDPYIEYKRSGRLANAAAMFGLGLTGLVPLAGDVLKKSVTVPTKDMIKYSANRVVKNGNKGFYQKIGDKEIFISDSELVNNFKRSQDFAKSRARYEFKTKSDPATVRVYPKSNVEEIKKEIEDKLIANDLFKVDGVSDNIKTSVTEDEAKHYIYEIKKHDRGINGAAMTNQRIWGVNNNRIEKNELRAARNAVISHEKFGHSIRGIYDNNLPFRYMDYSLSNQDLAEKYTQEILKNSKIKIPIAAEIKANEKIRKLGSYFKDLNGTEFAARGTQIKDFFGLKNGEKLTPEMLQYAKDNYVNLTKHNNNMNEFFDAIKDMKGATDWLNKNALANGGHLYGPGGPTEVYQERPLEEDFVTPDPALYEKSPIIPFKDKDTYMRESANDMIAHSIDMANSRTRASYPGGPSCIYTATDNFNTYNNGKLVGDDHRVASNVLFSANPEKYGFTKIPTNNLQPGDFYQFVGYPHNNKSNGYRPFHMTTFMGYTNSGIPILSYSNGGKGEAAIRHNKSYPFSVWQNIGARDINTYRYIGTPKEREKWESQWKDLYSIHPDYTDNKVVTDEYANEGHLFGGNDPEQPSQMQFYTPDYSAMGRYGFSTNTGYTPADNTRVVIPGQRMSLYEAPIDGVQEQVVITNSGQKAAEEKQAVQLEIAAKKAEAEAAKKQEQAKINAEKAKQQAAQNIYTNTTLGGIPGGTGAGFFNISDALSDRGNAEKQQIAAGQTAANLAVGTMPLLPTIGKGIANGVDLMGKVYNPMSYIGSMNFGAGLTGSNIGLGLGAAGAAGLDYLTIKDGVQNLRNKNYLLGSLETAAVLPYLNYSIVKPYQGIRNVWNNRAGIAYKNIYPFGYIANSSGFKNAFDEALKNGDNKSADRIKKAYDIMNKKY